MYMAYPLAPNYYVYASSNIHDSWNKIACLNFCITSFIHPTFNNSFVHYCIQ